MALTTIGSAGIADGAITNADVNNTAAIAQSKLAALAITDSEIADNALSGNKIDGGTISAFASTGIDDNADALAITITSAEKVGIGTATPGKELEVVGDLRLGFGATMTNEYGKSVYFSTDATPVDVASLRMKEHTSDNYGLELQTYSAGLATRMTILGDGKIGIGTTTPGDVLDVAGSVRLGTASKGVFETSDSFDARLIVGGGTNDCLNLYVGGSNKWSVNAVGTLHLWGSAGISSVNQALNLYGSHVSGKAVKLYASSTSTPDLTVNDGEVGIGTTTPGKQLHITKAAVADLVALSDAATIAVDFDTGQNFTVTLAGNRALGNPTNVTAGQTGSIFVTQDGTGSRTLSFGTSWEFPAATAPTLTTTAAAVDRIDYIVKGATSIQAVATLAYA